MPRLDVQGHFPGCYPGGSGCVATRCAEACILREYGKIEDEERKQGLLRKL